MAELSDRDREILHMRFVEEITQAEIGERLGCSQMHVAADQADHRAAAGGDARGAGLRLTVPTARRRRP